MPIFTAARGYQSNTAYAPARPLTGYEAWPAKGAASPAAVEDIWKAQRTIRAAVIAQQLVDTEAGIPLSPRVQLGRLDKAEPRRLRAALGAVDAATELVAGGVL